MGTGVGALNIRHSLVVVLFVSSMESADWSQRVVVGPVPQPEILTQHTLTTRVDGHFKPAFCIT